MLDRERKTLGAVCLVALGAFSSLAHELAVRPPETLAEGWEEATIFRSSFSRHIFLTAVFNRTRNPGCSADPDSGSKT